MTQIKNILLLGRTGSGKSTLANVLTGTNKFTESTDSVSETKDIETGEFEIDEEKVKYCVIDTVGVGDTQLETKDVLYRLGKVAYLVGDSGLNQIFFITRGRFTSEEVEAYKLLSSVIFESEIVNYTTIVRTSFPEFDDEQACKRDREKLIKENAKIANIMQSTKIIHVDNPPMVGRATAVKLAKEIRRDSRKVLLTHLGTCQDTYVPKSLKKLNIRIKNYMTEKEKLEKEIAEKERLIKEQKQRTNEQINKLKESSNKQIRDLEQRKAQQIKEIEQNSENQINILRNQNKLSSCTIDQLRKEIGENNGVSSALSSFYSLSEVRSTDFFSKTLVAQVYYLKSEFERVVQENEELRKNRDYLEEEKKERKRAEKAEDSRDWWMNEEHKERQRADQLEERIEEYKKTSISSVRIGGSFSPFFPF